MCHCVPACRAEFGIGETANNGPETRRMHVRLAFNRKPRTSFSSLTLPGRRRHRWRSNSLIVRVSAVALMWCIFGSFVWLALTFAVDIVLAHTSYERNTARNKSSACDFFLFNPESSRKRCDCTDTGEQRAGLCTCV